MISNYKYDHELKQKGINITKEIRDMTAIVVRGAKKKKERKEIRDIKILVDA